MENTNSKDNTIHRPWWSRALKAMFNTPLGLFCVYGIFMLLVGVDITYVQVYVVGGITAIFLRSVFEDRSDKELGQRVREVRERRWKEKENRIRIAEENKQRKHQKNSKLEESPAEIFLRERDRHQGITPELKKEMYLQAVELGQIAPEDQLSEDKIDEYFEVKKPIMSPEMAVNLYLHLVESGQIKDNPPMSREEAEKYFDVK